MRKQQGGAPEMNFKNIAIIVIIVIIVYVLIYSIYKSIKATNVANSQSPVIVSNIIDAYVGRGPITVSAPTMGLGQSISTWIYITDWNYNFGSYKPIIIQGSLDNRQFYPGLFLYPDTNALKVITLTSIAGEGESCDVQNIPLQKWVHICYVLDNRNVDIYIDGKLERSCALKGIPQIGTSSSTTNNIYITPGNPAGFMGKVGRTQYFTYTIQPNKVVDLYQHGPVGSSQYKVQFFQDGKVINFQKQSINS
jgi:hypothetical protein